jgi:capsular polysaccharide biosynthesis protein
MKQYNDTRMKLADANVVKKMDETQMGERFYIIDQPVVPQKPDKPKPLKILLAGLFAAMFCGLFASILAENLDHSIKSAEHLRRITKMPVLTVVPLIRDEEKPGKERVSAILDGLRSKVFRPGAEGKRT